MKNEIVVDDRLFSGMKMSEIKTFVKEYYNANLKGNTVKNIQKGITIKFSRKGFDHLIHARNVGYVKIKAIVVLKQMVENATYLNFKDRDSDDSKEILGYFNFSCKAIVEGKNQNFRIVIRLTKDGKFYYDHSVKVSK